MKETEIAWAAGLFDGEGWSGVRTIEPYRYFVLSISQADPEVLERFRRAVREGHVNGPYAKPPRGTLMWQYNAHGAAAHRVIKFIRPYLSSKKKDQARAAAKLEYRGQEPGYNRLKKRCKKGHPLDRVDPKTGWRSCSVCRKESFRRYARKKRQSLKQAT